MNHSLKTFNVLETVVLELQAILNRHPHIPETLLLGRGQQSPDGPIAKALKAIPRDEVAQQEVILYSLAGLAGLCQLLQLFV